MGSEPSLYAIKGKLAVFQSGLYQAKVILESAVSTFKTMDSELVQGDTCSPYDDHLVLDSDYDSFD